MKSLALASKPQVLENCPVLVSRTGLFFEPLKLCWKTPETSRKTLQRRLLFSSFEDRLKKNFEDIFSYFFFGEHLRLCPWSLSIPVLILKRVCPRKGCPWPRIFFVSLALASSFMFSTPPLATNDKNNNNKGDVLFSLSFFKHFCVQQYTCTTD